MKQKLQFSLRLAEIATGQGDNPFKTESYISISLVDSLYFEKEKLISIFDISSENNKAPILCTLESKIFKVARQFAREETKNNSEDLYFEIDKVQLNNEYKSFIDKVLRDALC